MKDFIKGRDIVLFGFQPWEIQTGSNFVDIAFELARYNRVLFINRALDRVSVWKHRGDSQIQNCLNDIRKKKNNLKKIHEQLWVLNPATVLESINWIPVAWLHDKLNFINNKRLAKQINKAISALGFSNVILINDNDFIRGRYLKQLVNCTDYIFYLRDYLPGVKYFRRHGPRLEAQTIRQATMVAANSGYLATYASRWNAYSFDIGQGFSMSISSQQSIPGDMQRIKKPVIGYAGYLSTLRIDEGIVQFIAQSFPECSIVLVGQTDPYSSLDGIAHLPNVHFLGCKPVAELSSYIRCFDICINPQKVNSITIGNYPRKIDEYLALGKPVVVTKTEAMGIFAQHTFQCTTKAAYVAAIEEIIGNPGRHLSPNAKESRILFASGHTWAKSMSRLGHAYYTVKKSSGKAGEHKFF